MDNSSINSLISNGLILKKTDLDPNNDYVTISKYQRGKNKSDSDGTSYKPYALPIGALQPTAKILRGLISQSGVGFPPTFLIQENTIGGSISWKYDGMGIYTANILGFTLTQNNTHFTFTNNTFQKNGANYFATGLVVQWVSNTSFQILTINSETKSLSDGLLDKTSLTIYKYD